MKTLDTTAVSQVACGMTIRPPEPWEEWFIRQPYLPILPAPLVPPEPVVPICPAEDVGMVSAQGTEQDQLTDVLKLGLLALFLAVALVRSLVGLLQLKTLHRASL